MNEITMNMKLITVPFLLSGLLKISNTFDSLYEPDVLLLFVKQSIMIAINVLGIQVILIIFMFQMNRWLGSCLHSG